MQRGQALIKPKLTFACVLKSGRMYGEDWVTRLKNGIARNCDFDFKFICLSDIELKEVETVPLIHNWPKYWSKIELFRPGIFEGKVVYIDLDSVVISKMNAFLNHKNGFTMLHEWSRPKTQEVYQSSVMMWDGDYREIYDIFKKAPDRYMAYFCRSGWNKDNYGAVKYVNIGDQGFIPLVLKSVKKSIHTFDEFMEENSIVSFKHHSSSRPPDGSIIVTFHGKSKAKMKSGWADKY